MGFQSRFCQKNLGQMLRPEFRPVPLPHTSRVSGIFRAAAMMAARCEWQDFNDLKTVPEQGNLDKLLLDEVNGMLQDLPELGNSFSSEIGSFQPMEDLKRFDEKLTVCFQNVSIKTETIAPVQLINEDKIMRNDE